MQTRPNDLSKLGYQTVRSTRRRQKPIASPTQWRAVQRLLRPPASALAALLDAGIWMGLAIALRLGADTALIAFPHLWLPVLLILLTPAAIAIGLSTWAPPLSLLLGYRLILIALGLILGGRL